MTQAALGALMGEWIMGKRLGNWALAWGAFFGLLPELIEGLASTVLSTAWALVCERGLAHSLVVMALASWGIGRGLARLWKQEKVTASEAGIFVFSVWAGHVLLDCFSTAGAALLWPVVSKRVAFDLLPQMDLLFTAPLVVAAVRLGFFRELKIVKKRGKKSPPLPPSPRRKWCYWGLGLSLGYLLLAVGMKSIAAASFATDLARRGTKFQRRMESPTPFNILLWRCVVDRGDEFWVGYRSVFENKQSPIRWTVYLKNAELLDQVATLAETKTLTSLTDGWWLARPHAKGAWLGDLRFPESRVWGSKKGTVDSRLAYSWVIDPSLKSDHLRPDSSDVANVADYYQRLAARITGNHQSWEANPRLAGVTGSLPEFLPVEESR
jgi:inner membrane protein